MMEQTIWTIKDVLDWSIPYLKKSGSDSPRLDAELLLCHVLSCVRLQLYMDHHKPLNPTERAAYRETIRRRAQGEPVAYIVGQRDFFGQTFRVNAHTLIPRPETEHLIEEVLKRYPAGTARNCLDIGAGSGCIAITLKKQRPEWSLEAWDISASALSVAEENAAALEAPMRFLQRDGLDAKSWEDRSGTFDLIVSNPPYIAESETADLPASVKNFEPHLALFAEDSGLRFYRTFAALAPKALRTDGKIFLEIGFRQASDVSSLLEDYGWRDIEVFPDLGGKDRVVLATRPH
jgi:release factor glutamine methyltransferase